jgi:hypothetical protein
VFGNGNALATFSGLSVVFGTVVAMQPHGKQQSFLPAILLWHVFDVATLMQRCATLMLQISVAP